MCVYLVSDINENSLIHGHGNGFVLLRLRKRGKPLSGRSKSHLLSTALEFYGVLHSWRFAELAQAQSAVQRKRTVRAERKSEEGQGAG